MSDSQKDPPKKESFAFLEKVFSSHNKIVSVHHDQSDRQVYTITRTYGDRITVYFTNLYTIGLADYMDIRARHPEVGIIIMASNWNGYTDQAKQHGIADRVGIFRIAEATGAINKQEFWKYVKQDRHRSR